MTKKLMALLFITMLLVVVGCTIRTGTKKASVGGIFISFDRGENWAPKNLYLHSGGAGSISGVSVLDLVYDPQDFNAIYLTSEANGLFYTYDAGKSWRRAEALGSVKIESVAVDPANKCVIYASVANTIKKTTDCNRSWQEVYVDTRKDKLITALVVDHYQNLNIYAGNNGGDVLKSLDGGSTWQAIERIKGAAVEKILVDPTDSRIIYVATKRHGIYKSVDSGVNWFDINDGLKPYSAALEYKDLIFDLSKENSLILSAKYGLLKSEDGGETWQGLKLITPVASTDIYAVGVNPKNNQEIYYTTASTFYKTVDGGKNWITRRLPSNVPAADMLINPNSPNIIYLGMKLPAK